METDMTLRKLSSHLAAGALALGTVTAAPAAAAAQPRPGHLFRLSSCITCSQHYPAIAGNAAGDLIASWLEPVNLVSEGVFGRLFSASQAPLGADFDLASAAASGPPQFDGAVAADTAGNFVAAWATIDADQSSILVQRFDVQGNRIGDPILVASDPASSPVTPSDFKPAVAPAPGGGFVVAWVSLVTGDAPPGPPRVMSRRFNSTGAPTGPAVQLSTGLAFGERPSLCVSSTGRVHAAWTFADAYRPFEPSLAGVAVRRLNPADVPIGPEQIVAPALAADSSVAIACGRANSYVVAWQSDHPPAAAGSDIVAQRFTRRGASVGQPFVVNQVVDQEQRNPGLFLDSSGAFVVVWEGNPGGLNGVRGRRFGGDGTPLSDEFPVYNAGQGNPSVLRPAISGLGTSGFVVAVDAPGGVVGRVFSLNGAAPLAPGAAETAAAEPGASLAEVETGAGTGNGRGAGGLW
jgi:hypothetical protein